MLNIFPEKFVHSVHSVQFVRGLSGGLHVLFHVSYVFLRISFYFYLFLTVNSNMGIM